LIRDVVGADITLVDTGEAVARQVQRRIQTELPNRLSDKAIVEFFTSGEVEQASRIMSVLWGEAVSAMQLPQVFL
jgi:glutamate racemase